MELFRIENITKQFSEKFVLQNFSFVVLPGDKINISGYSGIGKTTIFRLLLGFERPDAGKIIFDGEDLTDENVWVVRRKVAYVSQDLNIGKGRVSDFFQETLHYKANQHLRTDAKNRITEYLSLFNLQTDILTRQIEELSGGEKQRIAIINALILDRSIFFLDEITSALDPALKEKIMNFFLENKNFTVLYISHDIYSSKNTKIKTLKLC
jgi:putative ABC transport system ATP-binding protein